MTDRATQLNKLTPMLEIAYQSRHMQLTVIARRILDLKAQVSDLDKPRAADLNQPSTRAGADILWETWVTERKTKLQQEIARASRDLENMRHTVAQALAKLEVARNLEAKLSVEQNQTQERRASW